MSTNPFPPRCRERFRLDRLVARGGFGRVYRAYQIGLDRAVAVKILDASVLENEEDVARFNLEARITASLKHPHIVIVVDHEVEDGVPWIAYEFLSGQNLRDRLLENGTLSVKTTLDVGVQVASALSEAHAHEVIHRDIKPDNIQETEAGRYKVTDFGIAKWSTAGAIRTQAGIIVGTPAYLAPEQIRSQPVTAQTDLYSLGIVLYELLAGRPPFEHDLPIQVLHQHLQEKPPRLCPLRSDVPEDLEDVILKALAKDPADRHKGATAMQRALEEVAERYSASNPAAALARPQPSRQAQLATVRVDRQERTVEYKAKKPAKNPAAWGALAGAALAVGLGAAYALRPAPIPSPSPAPSIARPPEPTPPPKPTLAAGVSPIVRAAYQTTPDAMTRLEQRADAALAGLGGGSPDARRDFAALLQECALHMASFVDAGVLADVQLRFAALVERLLSREHGRVAPPEREALARRIVDWARKKPDHWLPLAMLAGLRQRDGDLQNAADYRANAVELMQTAIELAPTDARAPARWKPLAAAARAIADPPRQRALALAHRAWVLKLDRENKLSPALHKEVEAEIRALVQPPPLKPEEARCLEAAGDLEQRLAALHAQGADGVAEAQKLSRARLEQVRSQLVDRRGRALSPAVVDFLVGETLETARALTRQRRPADAAPEAADLKRAVADLDDLATLVLSPPIAGAATIGPGVQDRFAEAAGLLLAPSLATLDAGAHKAMQDLAGAWLKEYPESWAAWAIDAARARIAGQTAAESDALARALALFRFEHIAPPGGKANPRATRPWATLTIATLEAAHRKGDQALVDHLVVGYKSLAAPLTKGGQMSDSTNRKVEEVIARVYR